MQGVQARRQVVSRTDTRPQAQARCAPACMQGGLGKEQRERHNMGARTRMQAGQCLVCAL